MEYQPQRTSKKTIITLIGAAVLFVGGIVVGLIPYQSYGYSVCDPALSSLFGSHSATHSIADMFTGGECSGYTSKMMTVMIILFVLAAAATILGLRFRARDRAYTGQPGYSPAPQAQYDSPAIGNAVAALPSQPGYAPSESYSPDAVSAGNHPGYAAPAAAGQSARPFDIRLVFWGLGIIAGTIVVSLLVALLSFLPGFLQLIVWAFIELTVIWQVLKVRAKGDQVKLARAERWNPVGLAVTGMAMAKVHFELTRPQAHAPYAAAPAAPQPPMGQPDQEGAHEAL